MSENKKHFTQLTDHCGFHDKLLHDNRNEDDFIIPRPNAASAAATELPGCWDHQLIPSRCRCCWGLRH
ncbi:hypothetical protein QTO34_007716 [Cnephaeus nilssonii]|uniref:Uncharacterized protein n=1 Tax=Cnephaeus nilssonii TaxID=3371016 RepID=A0AA40HJJ1_CNENI|nr:hypothetical protein QTO34_007716 [Eptesicus nilssonii]